MSDFKITRPGFYKTRDGRKAEVLGRASLASMVCPWMGSITGRNDTATWDDGGKWISTGATAQDLIAPWTEPKKGTVWVNVYSDGPGFTHVTRNDADKAAGCSVRIACVSVNWTEGEGLS